VVLRCCSHSAAHQTFAASASAVAAVSGVLRVIMISIADVVGKPPTESVFFEKYARIASVIDEVVNEVSP
jgi:hypothetical protein